MDKTVIELFAGVGGFRVGLNNIKEIGSDGKAVEDGDFKFVWANQWEPSTKTQHAYDCYHMRFGDGPDSNQDISTVDKSTIPDHTLLCGGFPCQDYSVAHSLTTEKGIEGKKGVLWWQIRDILVAKKPPFVLLENVDRLLKSPAKQRGRDFGIMLRCMADLGYIVEWRVINAAEYGFPQRRRRIFIFACREDTKYGQSLLEKESLDVLSKDGIFAKQFPVMPISAFPRSSNLRDIKDLADLSDKYEFPFENSGFMAKGTAYTVRTEPEREEPTTIGEISESDVDEHYYLSEKQTEQFERLRGSKKIERFKPDGTPYLYSEGAMSPYDTPDLPGRTMLTSEGSVNRSTHIIKDPVTDRLRILTPIECERLNMFPDGWTDSGMPEKRRYFMMGNALVTGIISRLGGRISEIIDAELPEYHSREYTKAEVIGLLDKAMNHTFGELTGDDYFDNMPDDYMDKGLPGNIVEQCILKYKKNNDQAADIIVDGVDTEVKTTGFTVNDGVYTAKELISVTAVSVNDIVNQEFFDSSFWHKIGHMLLVYYHYQEKPPCKSKKYKSFPFCGYEFFSFSGKELEEIIREWTLVRDKVIEMNQRDNPREHYPNIRRELGDELAMLGIAPKNPPRFRLRQGLVTAIIRRYFERATIEALPCEINKFADLDAECHRVAEQYAGHTVRELLEEFGMTDYNPDNKALLQPIVIGMFGGHGSRYEDVDQFSKLGINVKTLSMSHSGVIKEEMKLFPVNFNELMENTGFEDSEIYSYFADHPFLFPVFEYTLNDTILDYVFQGFKRMSFDEDFIDNHVRRLWDDTRSLISENRLVRTPLFNPDGSPIINPVSKTQKSSLNFPSAKNYYVYIKLGGDNAADYTEEVNGIRMVKQWYWINTTMLRDDLKKITYL